MSDELINLEPGILEGVIKKTINKIREADITTVQALSMQVPKLLSDKAGIGEDTAERAISKAVRLVSEGFITGKQLHEKHGRRTRLTTGVASLDTLLGGGIESETTTEFSGEFGTGKSQICHVLAVLAQLPIEKGGLDGTVAWIDTEDTFRPDRIIQISRAWNLDPDEILSGIFHALAYNTAHQKLLTEHLYNLCPAKNVKLVIVDSVIGNLRSEYIGRGMLSARQDQLKAMTNTLGKVCISARVTVVYTNQVLGRPVMYGTPVMPTGGHIMGHAASTRIFLKKAGSSQTRRIARLIDSSYLPPGEAVFEITERGIESVE